jgi:hypothetical protein
MESFNNSDSELIIERLSCRSWYAERTAVQVKISSPPTFLSGDLRTASSAGNLRKLPVEILHLSLEFLDFQSLFSLLRVNTWCRLLVESLSAYRESVSHAAASLKALNITELLSVHSSIQVYSALRSESCTLCTDYGPFLFLPTAKRCCLNCLRDNSTLRLLTPRQASLHFGLESGDLSKLLKIRGPKGSYHTSACSFRPRKDTILVTVEDAKSLGLAIHGSKNAIQHFIRKKQFDMRAAFPKQPGHPSYVPDGVFIAPKDPEDLYCAMATAQFPSLQEFGKPEYGLWCLGCSRAGDIEWRPNTMDVNGVPKEFDSVMVQKKLKEELRAWSESKFLDHVRHCAAALSILADTKIS